MFIGTSYLFRILYFLTSMMPAYVIFILQLKINGLVCCGLIIMICTLEYVAGFFIRSMIIKRSKNAVNKIAQVYIKSKNGNVLTFVFGVIIPSILFPDNASNIKLILIQVGIQIMLFIVMQKSSDIIPNIVLILEGVAIYTTKDGNYIISLDDIKNGIKVRMYRLGDTERAKIFIGKGA
ncbi:hypothetical protein [Limosilactobacillus vaginalis]|uniref:hypothetical protein n=1 Tax=Limosilactobacillus vaginalis TaxID=1633 RepID=UPI0024BB7203|nr:hypothetical protein [Limosilactobacillus vaginalis]